MGLASRKKPANKKLSKEIKCFYKCKYCDKIFLSQKHFKRHKRTEHMADVTMNNLFGHKLLTTGDKSANSIRSVLPSADHPTSKSINQNRNKARSTSPDDYQIASSTKDNQASRAGINADIVATQKLMMLKSKNIPLPIGKKFKFIEPDGTEKEEWFRNPTFSGA